MRTEFIPPVRKLNGAKVRKISRGLNRWIFEFGIFDIYFKIMLRSFVGASVQISLFKLTSFKFGYHMCGLQHMHYFINYDLVV